MPDDTRYCAYLRKSRADAVREKLEEGYDALAHHRQTLEALAQRMDAQIARWYSDGIKSGESLQARPDMRELLESVRSRQWDGVLVMEVERLTRGDMVDQGTIMAAFVDTGTLIVTPGKVYDPTSEADMEYFEFGLFMSRREFKTIKKRLVAGRLAAVREGQYIGTYPPYGYDKCRIDGMKTLAPNGNAKYVRMVFEMYARGESYRDIAHALDVMGAKPDRGRKWNPNSIRNMVVNDIYIGKISWNKTKMDVYYENGRRRYRTVPAEGVTFDGLHRGIIEKELWDAAKRRTDAAPVRGAFRTRNHYGRILKCAECGRALRFNDGGNAKEPMLTHLHPGEGCRTKGCRVSVLDDLVVDSLLEACGSLDAPVGAGPGKSADAMRAECLANVERCRRAISDNFDRMERGVISESDFVERRAVLEAEMEASAARADELAESTDAAREQRAVTLRECIAAIRDPGISEEAKRQAIWAAIDHIDYQNRAKRGEDDIRLAIYLR